MRVAQQRSIPTPARRLQRREGERKLVVGNDTSCGASSGLCLEQLNPYLRGWRAGGVVMGVAETAVVATTTEVRARGSPSQRSRERAAITLLDGAHQSSGGRRASTSIRRHQQDGKRSRACPGAMKQGSFRALIQFTDIIFSTQNSSS